MHDPFIVMWLITLVLKRQTYSINEIHLEHVVIILKIHLFNCRQVLIDIFVNICRLSKQLDDLANADSSLFSDEQKVC